MAIGKQISDKNPDGTALGQSAADLIAFYGTVPVSQRASAVQITLASSASYGPTQAALVNEIVATLTGLGLWKGGA